MTHPALERMRPAQARAKHLLDLTRGPHLLEDPPNPDAYAERRALEHAYRLGARELLDDNTRVWLEWIEQRATLNAYGHEPVSEEPAQPAKLDELHQLVTLAHHLQHSEAT